MSLEFETSRVEPDITVVRLVGRLTAGRERQALERLIHDLVDRGERKLILDLSGITKIDSAGARLVIQCLFTMRKAAGELRLASSSSTVARLFFLTPLDAVLPIYWTAADASLAFDLKNRT